MPVFNPPPTKLELIINGVTYPMSDGTVLFQNEDGPTYLYYLSDSGLGMPPVTRHSERGPRQHGVTDVGFLFEPRLVSFVFAIHCPPTSNPRSLYTARDMVLRMFNPFASDASIKFRYTLSNGQTRQIDGFFINGLTFATSDREVGTWFQRFSVDVQMPDPTFYDPYVEHVGQWINTQSTHGFFVPLPVPVSIRNATYEYIVYYEYIGSAPSQPIITLYGPLNAPRLVHNNTGSVIDLPTAELSHDESYVIDLRYGLRKILDNNGIDHTHELSDDSTFDNWHLPVTNVLQSITMTASRIGSQGTAGMITWNDRFIGI